ncbi:MAG TPA: hypothetical protein VK930_01730 [Verrucomicrobiae bacterium]|jgi:hypothetical protein|nr:hypothetical protein [Verrucomicrobiae bacterium]
MRVHLRFLLIALMLHASHSFMAADDAKGWFEGDCGGTTFQIEKFASASPVQNLVLRLTSQLAAPLFEGAGWLDVQAKRCSGVGKCEDATQAKIWLNETKGRSKRISGKYTVDFGSQHFEGRFRVKYRRKNPPAICE